MAKLTTEYLAGWGRADAERRLYSPSAHIESGGVLEIAKGGSTVRLKAKVSREGFHRDTKRGMIRGFSHGSRTRLLDRLNSVERSTLPNHGKFVLLTYGDEFGSDWRRWKQDIRDMHDAMRRKYGPFRAVWRMEFQERGAPHFHLMVWIDVKLDFDFMREAWSRIATEGYANHGLLYVGLQAMRSWGGCVWYCAKYISKLAPADAERHESGRHWGTWGGELWKFTVQKAVLTVCEFLWVRYKLLEHRAKGREVRVPASKCQGCRVFMNNEQVYALLDEVLDGDWQSEDDWGRSPVGVACNWF